MKTHPEQLLARAADRALTTAERRELEAHLATCEACRDSLDSQRLVSQALTARMRDEAAPGFSARVSARLDEEEGGILELANWRAWTAGLVPVAAALVLASYLGVGTSPTDSAAAPAADTATFESWASASAGTSPASVFLQPASSGDQLLETVLTGAAPASSRETSDVR